MRDAGSIYVGGEKAPGVLQKDSLHSDLDNPFAPSQYCKAEDILLLLCNTYVSPIKNCRIEYFLIAELATIQLNWQGMRLVAHQ